MKAARDLVNDALAAKGGKAKLEALKTLRMSAKGTTTVPGPKGPVPLPVEIQRVLVIPDKMRIDAKIHAPGQDLDVIVSVEGKTGWQSQPDQTGKNQVVDLKNEDMATVDFERWREPELILLKAADPNGKIAPLPDAEIDGKPQSVVRIAAPIADLDVALYFDKKTKLLTRMEYSDIDPKGTRHTQTDDFADYRDVKGYKVAYKRVSTTQGRVTKLELGKVEIDEKIDSAAFAKPK